MVSSWKTTSARDLGSILEALCAETPNELALSALVGTPFGFIPVDGRRDCSVRGEQIGIPNASYCSRRCRNHTNYTRRKGSTTAER